MDLEGKTIVVTGASKGIGKAIALRCAQEGAAVALISRHLEELQEAIAEIEEASPGSRCMPVVVDVTDFDAVGSAFDAVRGQMGPIDVLINNVGWDITQRFWENTPDFWDRVIDVNLKSVLNCSRNALDDMMERGGHIVSISSDAGRVGSSGETAYAAAKGGVIAFTKSLAREVARYGINVNCVCPGPTATPLYFEQPEKIRTALERAIPLRRVAAPHEIADAAVFFARDDASYITGQILSVSGGLSMQG